MKQIIHTIKSIRPEKRPRDLEKALSKVLISNAQEREILIRFLDIVEFYSPRDLKVFSNHMLIIMRGKIDRLIRLIGNIRFLGGKVG